jgi:hypothetical protein
MENESYINPGIETLVELGFINRLVLAHGTEAKGARNGILNCLGCRLLCNQTVSVSEISECSGDDRAMVSVTITRLERAGLVLSEKVPSNLSPGFNKGYKISDTTGGMALRETIGVPPKCGLEK